MSSDRHAQRGQRLRRATLLGTACALVATGAVPALLHKASAQTDPVPTSRVFHVVGHGWGHGHGLSQDGAKGAAEGAHLSASQIVSFYYPHTAAASIGDPTLRVLLQSAAGNYVDVGKPSGSGSLTIDDLASNYKADLPTSATKFRFTVGTSSITISQFVSGSWQPWAPAGHASFAGPIHVHVKNAATQSAIRVLYPSGTERDYYGYLSVVRAAASNIDALAVMPMEYYLRGVVPRESPSSWPAAALQAQAIAARSYAEYEREHAGSRDYDICDSTSCQVFGGTTEVTSSGSTDLEPASTDSAVSATAGQVRTYGGQVIFAQYSADDGGWTTDGGQPYLIAQRDPYDAMSGESSYYWSARLPVSALESAYPSIGSLRSIRVTQRDGNGEWGGRVLQAQLIGSKATAMVTGSAVMSAYSWPSHSDGLRSMWWEIVPTPAADFDGNGTADVSVWRPSSGNWYANGHGATHWGTTGDQPVPGDYNGDGIVERAVWRPSNGDWYVPGTPATHYGTSGDIPVPGDYNGDGKTDFAVFRPSNDTWYVRGVRTTGYGLSTDVPVPGDYNGDGVDDLALWRPSTGVWYILGVGSQQWGTKGDIPVPGDYQGDGTTDIATWRPGTGRWYVHGSTSFQYGTAGDVPVPADYDGDGVTQAAVFRPSSGTWFRKGFSQVRYGVSSDEPVPLPYAIYRTH